MEESNWCKHFKRSRQIENNETKLYPLQYILQGKAIGTQAASIRIMCQQSTEVE